VCAMGLWEGGFGLNERSVELEVFAARERERERERERDGALGFLYIWIGITCAPVRRTYSIILVAKFDNCRVVYSGLLFDHFLILAAVCIILGASCLHICRYINI